MDQQAGQRALAELVLGLTEHQPEGRLSLEDAAAQLGRLDVALLRLRPASGSVLEMEQQQRRQQQLLHRRMKRMCVVSTEAAKAAAMAEVVWRRVRHYRQQQGQMGEEDQREQRASALPHKQQLL